jgi:hypothetical protein
MASWRPIGAYRISEFALKPKIQDDQPDPVKDSPADRGCHLWYSCLSCPRERCILDEPLSGQVTLKRPKNR